MKTVRLDSIKPFIFVAITSTIFGVLIGADINKYKTEHSLSAVETLPTNQDEIKSNFKDVIKEENKQYKMLMQENDKLRLLIAQNNHFDARISMK